jgi:Na+/proline symporter
MTAAIYWKKANQAAAVASSVTGLVSWLALEYFNLVHTGRALPSELMAAGLGLVVLVIVTYATQHLDPPKPATDIDGKPVDMTDRLGTLSFPSMKS